MPAYPQRERLIPHRVLDYLLYTPESSVDWLESLSGAKVRVITGPAARALRMRNNELWKAIRWLKAQQLIIDYEKEEKRGTVLVTLRQPTNINPRGK